MICEGYKKIACWSIAISGFTALLSLVSNRPDAMIAASAGLLSLGLTLLTLEKKIQALTVAIMAAIGAMVSYYSLTIGVLTMLGAGIVAALPGNPGGVLMLGAAYALAAVAGHQPAVTLAALTIAASGLVAYAYTGRAHSTALSAAALIPLAAPEYTAIITASILAALLGTGRIVEVSGCPFRVENRLQIAGFTIAGLGIVIAAVLGDLAAWALAYWLLGFNMLIAGALVPVTTSP